jgi:hypothetical protein
MKKLFLVLLISMLSIGSYAQNISINVRMHGGNERLYFGNSHAWMQSHGYHYHQGGYYIGHNRRIYPNRREYYNPTNNSWGNQRYGHRNSKKYNNNHHRMNNRNGNKHQQSNHGKKGKR